MSLYPVYLEAHRNGNLDRVIESAFKLLSSCTLCPHRCKVNRLKDEKGYCKTGLKAKVCSYLAHHGEEPAISGQRGSGTIFFSNCNMACVYCQNYDFSQKGEGREVEFEELAGFMLQLQEMRCHNINLVTPTHVLPQILKALSLAITKGLNLPLVYNTGGYELAQIIKLLTGIVDIYLPDMRYGESDTAIKYSDALDYPLYNQAAVKEMHRQVGVEGLIIRHLVLPNNIAGTDKIMEFISSEISKDAYISLMSQYFPCYKAGQFKELARRITFEEYKTAQMSMEKYGLHNGWVQDEGGLDRFAGINIKQNLL
ncbi:MAG TPA: radical SAM protein [Candidatus Omnitrophota bacterium]|nr:radical SAM protein [Candidatus Omnitrophota bacterium]